MSFLTRHMHLVGLALVLAASFACDSDSLRVPEPRSASPNEELPFEQQGNAEVQSLVPPKEELPPGTMVAVQVHDNLSSRTAKAGDHFVATLAAPVIIDNQTVLPAGTQVSGKVLAAKLSGRRAGYLRITLQELVVGSGRRTVVTTSVFASGDTTANHASASLLNSEKRETDESLVNASNNSDISQTGDDLHSADVTITPSRRLIFRLTQALSLRD
ncbi:MAG TPA: hypothetical protein VHR84_07720 [Terriglobales bacterium]|jgi:hypothetical protein|nr:hypothetical protein [Terriglobales bacterium]